MDGRESDRLHARNMSHENINIDPHDIKNMMHSNKIYLTHSVIVYL